MQIIKKKLISTRHGTHKYFCEWFGAWTEKEVINAVDGGCGNYGGRVALRIRDDEHKRYGGFVEVYYD